MVFIVRSIGQTFLWPNNYFTDGEKRRQTNKYNYVPYSLVVARSLILKSCNSRTYDHIGLWLRSLEILSQLHVYTPNKLRTWMILNTTIEPYYSSFFRNFIIIIHAKQAHNMNYNMKRDYNTCQSSLEHEWYKHNHAYSFVL